MTEVDPYVERRTVVYEQHVELEMEEGPPILPPREKGSPPTSSAIPHSSGATYGRPTVALARQPNKNYEDLPKLRKSYEDLPRVVQKNYDDLPTRNRKNYEDLPKTRTNYEDLPRRQNTGQPPSPRQQPPSTRKNYEDVPKPQKNYEDLPRKDNPYGDLPRDQSRLRIDTSRQQKPYYDEVPGDDSSSAAGSSLPPRPPRRQNSKGSPGQPPKRNSRPMEGQQGKPGDRKSTGSRHSDQYASESEQKKFVPTDGAPKQSSANYAQNGQDDLDDTKSPVFDPAPPANIRMPGQGGYEPKQPPLHYAGQHPMNPNYPEPVQYHQPALKAFGKSMPPPDKQDSVDDILDYMTLSIIALVCCLPYGMMAFKKSKKVRKGQEEGDREAAYTASLEAKQFGISGIITGIVVVAVAILMVAFVWVVILTTR